MGKQKIVALLWNLIFSREHQAGLHHSHSVCFHLCFPSGLAKHEVTSISETKVVNEASESSDLSFCLPPPQPIRDHWAPLPPPHTQTSPLIVPHHPATPSVVSCKKKKFTSSYRQEMTNVTFFMRRIKNSKDLFPSLHSETQGKKTSLNNGWEKGLLRKESRCGMIEQRGARRGDGGDNMGMDREKKNKLRWNIADQRYWWTGSGIVRMCTEGDVTWRGGTRCSHSLRRARPGHSHKAWHSGRAHDQAEKHAAFPSTEAVCLWDAAGNVLKISRLSHSSSRARRPLWVSGAEKLGSMRWAARTCYLWLQRFVKMEW